MSSAFKPVRAHFVPSQQRGRDVAVYIFPDNPDLCYEWCYQLQLADGMSLLYMCCGCKGLRSKDKRKYKRPVASCHIVDGFFVTDPVDTRRPHFCEPRPTLKALVRRLIIGKCNEVRERAPDGRPATEELDELLSTISKEQIGNFTEAQRLTMIEEITNSSEYARDNALRVIQRAKQKARREGGKHDKMKQYLCIVCLKVREYPFERKPPFNLRLVSVLLATLVLFNNLETSVANEIYTACAMHRKVLCKDHYLEAAASLISEMSKRSAFAQLHVDLNALHISEKMVPKSLVTLLEEQCPYFGTREKVTARSIAFFLNDTIAYCVDKRNLKEGPECVVPVEKLEDDEQEDDDSDSWSSSAEPSSEMSPSEKRLLAVLQGLKEVSARMQAEDLLQVDDYQATSTTHDEASTSFPTSFVSEEAEEHKPCSILTPTSHTASKDDGTTPVLSLNGVSKGSSYSSMRISLDAPRGTNSRMSPTSHGTRDDFHSALTPLLPSVAEEKLPASLSAPEQKGYTFSPMTLATPKAEPSLALMPTLPNAPQAVNSSLGATSLVVPKELNYTLASQSHTAPMDEFDLMLPASTSAPVQDSSFTSMPTTLRKPKEESHSSLRPASLSLPPTNSRSNPTFFEAPRELDTTATPPLYSAPKEVSKLPSTSTSLGASDGRHAVLRSSEPSGEQTASPLPKRRRRSTKMSLLELARIQLAGSTFNALEVVHNQVNTSSTNLTQAQPRGGPSPSTDDALSETDILPTKRKRPYYSLGNLVSQMSTKKVNIPWSSRLFVVEGSQLLRLLRYCPGCGTNINSSGTEFRLSSEGAIPNVEIFCQTCQEKNGKGIRWKGQEEPDAKTSER